MMRLKNIGFHTVKNEKEALDLLCIGDTNRMTSETPMTPRSSRSHCIFTIYLSAKKFGCDRYCRAKMYLVDLAGSERVYKYAITGTILTEAKYINLSLHYLEQVIVCLGQENTSHVPYRNSLLTAILRDSLGGNCITIMLANLSISAFNLEKTISTCRFAQRVALIRNDVNLILKKDVKTEMDLLKIENKRLKSQIDELKEQLALERSKGGSMDYYKDIVLQRNKEISLLIETLNKEKIRKCRKTKDKMVETDKPILSKVVQKSFLHISHSESLPIEDYSSSISHGLNPAETLFHDINFDRKYFDSSSLDASQTSRIGAQKEFQCDSLMLHLNHTPRDSKVQQEEAPSIKEANQLPQKDIVKNIPCASDGQKASIESPRISFKTLRILRQILCLEKKSPRQS